MSDKKPPAQDPVPVDDDFDPVERTLGGRGFRGQVAGCPTGLSMGRKPRPKDKPADAVEGPPATGSEGKRTPPPQGG